MYDIELLLVELSQKIKVVFLHLNKYYLVQNVPFNANNNLTFSKFASLGHVMVC